MNVEKVVSREEVPSILKIRRRGLFDSFESVSYDFPWMSTATGSPQDLQMGALRSRSAPGPTWPRPLEPSGASSVDDQRSSPTRLCCG